MLALHAFFLFGDPLDFFPIAQITTASTTRLHLTKEESLVLQNGPVKLKRKPLFVRVNGLLHYTFDKYVDVSDSVIRVYCGLRSVKII